MDDEMTDIVKRLRERASVAREENTGTAIGDALHFEEAANAIERLDALAKCESCGNGACESCMNTGYQHPHKAELALASVELAKLPADAYWLLAKGRTRPDEPLWGVRITDQDGNPIAEAEGDHPADVVRHAAALSLLLQEETPHEPIRR